MPRLSVVLPTSAPPSPAPLLDDVLSLHPRPAVASLPRALPTQAKLIAAVGALAPVEARPEQYPSPTAVLRDLLRASERDGQGATAFYAVDLGAVVRRFADFTAAMPRVTPYFAVKCNPDPAVVRVLAAVGAHFDCASTEEIELVQRAGAMARDEMDSRIVFANPCKQRSHLKQAASLGVGLMTFDGEDELLKVRDLHPRARLLLRIAVEDSHALCPLSSKYGASMEDVPNLLLAAHRLGLTVVGVAFHVGSGCTSVLAYVEALHRARQVFDHAARLGLPPLSTVDIGGGFPGFDGECPITFREIAVTVNDALAELFGPSVRVIAEPGRYFVAAAYSLATQVLSRRSGCVEGTSAIVIGDGVYGSFKDALLLDLSFSPNGHIPGGGRAGGGEVLDAPLQTSTARASAGTTLYGPTGDARDVVARNVPLPLAMVPGDWLYFHNMGAYTISLATAFNSMTRPHLHYYIGANLE
jgi:ornithine decarboxylase